MGESHAPNLGHGHGLALAILKTSPDPLLLLDGKLTVLGLSDSFCASYGVELGNPEGVDLRRIGAGEWDTPQLLSLLKVTIYGDIPVLRHEMELTTAGCSRRLAIEARRLDHGEDGLVRVLMKVTNAASAKLVDTRKDDLIREKETLLKEMQHRTANSLQIIASVLMQSARRVQSEETRGHLRDAHCRVLSVAELQRELAMPGGDTVGVRVYMKRLCASLGASMIHDPDEMQLEVIGDEGTVGPDVSVSLGLIVTELVINALKHAFPNGRQGKITVACSNEDGRWAISVTDDGIGMPDTPDRAKAGVGTSIVEALARRLAADIEVLSAGPGTVVKISQSRAAEATRGAHSAI